MTADDQLSGRSAVIDRMGTGRCRGRTVRDIHGRQVGRVDVVLTVPSADGREGDAGEAFWLVVLGSVSRLGNETRAIPAALLAEERPDGSYVLPCSIDAIINAPIHVECSRCRDAAWFGRVREHFAAFASPGSSSGKTPHSSSP